MKTDYLIIGQGISGTLLSRNLLNAGKSVIVIDDYKTSTASRVASGIINPVTGRRVVRTWMIEELLPFALETYTDIGDELGITAVYQKDMLTFHTTSQMSSAWHERITDGEEYLQNVTDNSLCSNYFNIKNGIGITSPCLLIDLPTLLPTWRKKLVSANALIEEKFDIEKCTFSGTQVLYNNIEAEKIILCNGIDGFNNIFFNKLPYAFSKGEALIAHIPGLPPDNIYKQGINIVPLQNGYFWIGSSFEWEFENNAPTTAFRKNTEAILSDWLKLPYKITEHKSAIRPASLDRRPFVGLHPFHKTIGILNGMGTKGCSLSPYFAHQLTNHLLFDNAITPLADISRFSRLLSH